MTAKTIRDIILTALLVLFVVCVVSVRKSEHAGVTPSSGVAIAHAEARTTQPANVDLNRALPAMIDNDTLMTRIEAGAAADTYYITSS